MRHASASGRRTSRSAAFYDAEMAPPTPPQSGRNAGDTVRRQRRMSEATARGTGGRISAAQSQGNAMKVYVRVRPFSERELAQQGVPTHSTVRIDVENPAHMTLLDPSRNFEPTVTYPFTRCFWSVFERTKEDPKRDKTMTDMRDTVDTYLNGGMNSARRPRAQSLVSQEKLLSARGRTGKEVMEAPPAYTGSGSTAVVVDGNVSHPPYASQAEVYKFVGKPILLNTIDGYNGCVFAYGQTGSGKTFTMMGYAPAPAEARRAQRLSEQSALGESSRSESFAFGATDSPDVLPLDGDNGEDVVNKSGIDPAELQGIIPRVCTDLFDGMRKKRQENDTLTYRVEVSYYEIYNEKVFDLIKPNGAELRVGNNPISGPYVDGLTTKVVQKEEDVLRIIRKGMQMRHTAQTKFNDRSSRSHAILSFNILQIYLDSVGSTTKLESKLNLVDLAGSERAGAAGADRPEYKEGVNINLSLTVLGRVIDCLADLSQNKLLAVPVPYRDSRLTMLLMDSIGGNSQTSMVATISPHVINFEEMRQTVRYAARAKQIINRAVRNEDPQVVYIRELKSEVERLQQLLKEAGGHDFTRDYVLELEERVRHLEDKCAEQERVMASLRAELESAGIVDPTRTGAASANGADAGWHSGSVILQATASLQLQLDTANREIAKLQAELLERASKAGDSQVQVEQEAKILALQRKLDGVQESLRERDNLLRSYASFQLPWTMEIVSNTFEGKGLAILRECRALLTANSLLVDEVMNKGKVSGLVALGELQKKHELELAALVEQHRQQAAETETHYEQRDAERQRKHREALAAVESKLRDSISTYEQEKKRLGQERESMRVHYEDLLAKEAMSRAEALKKLRDSLSTGPAERQRANEAIRATTEEYEQKLKDARTELDRLRKESESELTKLRTQNSTDAAKKESELNEKDRQRRDVERQLAALRQENLNVLAEAKRVEREKQEQMKEMVHRQESLIAIASSAVSAWEQKASTALDKSLATLKGFVEDKDNVRQRAKDLAYRGAAAAASGAAARRASDSKAFDEKKEREYKELLESMKKAKETSTANMMRLQRDFYEQQTRIRGIQGGTNGQDTTPSDANGA